MTNVQNASSVSSLETLSIELCGIFRVKRAKQFCKMRLAGGGLTDLAAIALVSIETGVDVASFPTVQEVRHVERIVYHGSTAQAYKRCIDQGGGSLISQVLIYLGEFAGTLLQCTELRNHWTVRMHVEHTTAIVRPLRAMIKLEMAIYAFQLRAAGMLHLINVNDSAIAGTVCAIVGFVEDIRRSGVDDFAFAHATCLLSRDLACWWNARTPTSGAPSLVLSVCATMLQQDISTTKTWNMSSAESVRASLLSEISPASLLCDEQFLTHNIRRSRHLEASVWCITRSVMRRTAALLITPQTNDGANVHKEREFCAEGEILRKYAEALGSRRSRFIPFPTQFHPSTVLFRGLGDRDGK